MPLALLRLRAFLARRLTHPFADALLIALLVMLARDAAFFLRYGDLKWLPWSARILDAGRLPFVVFPALGAACLAESMRLPRPLAWLLVAGFALGGDLLVPELAHN